jgi:hypothetical protein
MTAHALVLFALCSPAPLAAQAPNRLWIGRVELVGPLARVELDCGAEGTTRIDAALVAGERRALDVPVAWAPALGLAGLAAHAPPEVRVEPSGASARWLGLAPEQPEARWTRLPPGLRLRPRPPVDGSAPSAPPAALLLVVAAQLAVLGLASPRSNRAREKRAREPRERGSAPARARRLGAAGIAVASALAAAGLALRGGAGDDAPLVLVDADLGSAAAAVRATATSAALALDPAAPGLRVETAVAGAPLDYAVDLAAGTWSARAPGGVVAFRAAPPPGPEWSDVALAPAWWRSPAGEWTRYAAVRAGAGRPEPGADPPGWLAAALPPGRSVLIGRPEGGAATWVRAVGAEAPR